MESPPQEESCTYARDTQYTDRPDPHREAPPTQGSPTQTGTSYPYREAPLTRYPPIQGSPTHTGKPHPYREAPPTFGSFFFLLIPFPFHTYFVAAVSIWIISIHLSSRSLFLPLAINLLMEFSSPVAIFYWRWTISLVSASSGCSPIHLPKRHEHPFYALLL